ncbi:MAG: glycosyltransferase [Phototrophicaceae bacterium]
MHILMVTPGLPYPLQQGRAIRTYGVLHGMVQAGFRVTLLSFHDAPAESLHDTPLAALCEQIITVPAPPPRPISQRLTDVLFSGRADLEGRLSSAAMTQALQELVTDQAFDAVQFEGVELGAYLLALKALHPHIPMIYSAHNAEADLQRVIADIDAADLTRLHIAVYSRVQANRLQRFESAVCHAADHVIAVSDEDAALLTTMHGGRAVAVIPSGVFADQYATPPQTPFPLEQNPLVFTGKMDYRPNVDAMLWFGERILPKILEQTGATLYVVGQKPHRRLAALGADPHIHLTGWVEQVQPYLYAAAVYVAPLRMGSGTRLKLLEAMAAGCAIVATPIAAAGLNSAVRAHMRLADDETRFAQAVIQLLKDPTLRQHLGAAAQHSVREHYDWGALVTQIKQVYEGMALGG